MPIDKRWEQLEPSDWDSFAQAWIAELREPRTTDSEAASSEEKWDVGGSVTQMNFTATPEQQWQFILLAMKYAEADEELSHVAAGPVEYLLGWHGEQYIDAVEYEAERNPTFARMLTGVWEYKMTETVWQRVQALQAKVSEPLRKSNAQSNDA
jgi:hypothetical protein